MAHSKQQRAFTHGEDPLVVCPNNPDHRVSKDRLEMHTPGFRDEYRRTLVNCPYSSGHLVSEEDVQQHLASCPDRCSAGHANQCVCPLPDQGRDEPSRARRMLGQLDKDIDDCENWRPPAKELREYPQPKTSIRFLPAEQLSCSDIPTATPRTSQKTWRKGWWPWGGTESRPRSPTFSFLL
ncbi:hypothetical protein HPB48_003842 [Haemaphysalis longicornis]|uniref:CHHC U11-48K-type domain-containing protein n=1 Tax=Haemaphysalis longicornis TaxID=44386 RepID=A0A9J6FDA5_HAELO|nr:hypothetical protein HPB48_003842 [Haemaphysalis longicornis]